MVWLKREAEAEIRVGKPPWPPEPCGEGLTICEQSALGPPAMLIIVAKVPFGEVFWLGRRLILKAISPNTRQCPGCRHSAEQQRASPDLRGHPPRAETEGIT